VELYNLAKDIGETTDVADAHPEVVARIEALMEKAVEPNSRYEIGTVYKGKPIWRR